MGFWDAQLTDLEAMGIEFSPLFERMLEEGGQVLRIRHLLTPDSTPELEEPCYDQHNRPVRVIEKIDAHPVRGRAKDSMRLIAEAVDSETSDWRIYPSFLGYLEDCDRYGGTMLRECMRQETAWYYRFWDCYPLLDESLYETLASACAARINDSLYGEIREIAEMEWNDGGPAMSISDLWLYLNDLPRLGEKEAQAVEQWMDDTRWDQDRIDVALRGYEQVVLAGYLPPPTHDYRDGPFDAKHFEINPLEQYLQHDPFAQDVWLTMNLTRQAALRQIATIMTPSEWRLFKFNEGITT